MAELREFAQHSSELNTMDVRLVPISVDDQQHAHEVWEKVVDKKFTILSDPGATVIKRYGLLHEGGHGGKDIALRTTLLIGPEDTSAGGVSVSPFPIFRSGKKRCGH